ncbi:MAG: DUF362 domain-containing protein [Firmicutes bacterium]|nr:DUF362 domain-containing protein [Bacillota bacterium]
MEGEVKLGLVVVERCPDYNDDNVLKVLRKVFESLGGVNKYIKPGMKVVLKPNLVKKKRPEDAATTHPSVVKAVAKLVREVGGIVTIVESPGGLFTISSLRGIYSFCGIEKAALEVGANLNYNLSETVVENPDGKYLKRVTIVKALADADLIINLPKLKTHGQMVYTGAVKNMFGAVPGELKAEYHLRMSQYDEFANALIDIYLSVKPVLNIMDAVVGMDGAGPTAGNPKQIGLIIAGEDGFEVDFTALKLINANPLDIPVINQAVKRRLCPDSFENIEICCEGLDSFEDLDSFKVENFHMPQLDTLKTIMYYDRGIMKFFINWLKPRPVFQHEKCIGCTECKRVCPAGVISMKNHKPEVDLKGCIRCFCCQELCPEKAVYIKRPALLDIYIRHRKKVRMGDKNNNEEGN